MSKDILGRFHFMTPFYNLEQLEKLTEEEITNLSDDDFVALSRILGDWRYGCSKGVVHYSVGHVGRSFKNGVRMSQGKS